MQPGSGGVPTRQRGFPKCPAVLGWVAAGQNGFLQFAEEPKIQPVKPQGTRTRTPCHFLSYRAPYQRAFDNVACNALAICSASRTGTAFPICLYFDVKSPANSSFFGKVCIAAASRQLRRRVPPFFPNLHSSLPSLTISGEDGCKATCFAIAGIVNDTSSHPRFLLRDI